MTKVKDFLLLSAELGRMEKTARILFVLFGILGPIAIGGLHTWTHFSQLIGPEVRCYLSAELPINGEMQSYWHTWGIMSFMMGISMVAIGLLNAAYCWGSRPIRPPHVPAILVMMGFLAGVTYASLTFEQMPQLIGGLMGLLGLSVCFLLSWRNRRLSDA